MSTTALCLASLLLASLTGIAPLRLRQSASKFPRLVPPHPTGICQDFGNDTASVRLKTLKMLLYFAPMQSLFCYKLLRPECRFCSRVGGEMESEMCIKRAAALQSRTRIRNIIIYNIYRLLIQEVCFDNTIVNYPTPLANLNRLALPYPYL